MRISNEPGSSLNPDLHSNSEAETQVRAPDQRLHAPAILNNNGWTTSISRTHRGLNSTSHDFVQEQRIQDGSNDEDSQFVSSLSKRNEQIPPGFHANKTGDFNIRQLKALRMLMDGPTKEEAQAHQIFFTENRRSVVPELFGEGISRIWQHTASLREWKTQIDKQLKALNALLEKGITTLGAIQTNSTFDEQLRMSGIHGEIVRIPFLNALMQDILVLSANERAEFESSGISTAFQPGFIPSTGLVQKRNPLNLKRFENTVQLLAHIKVMQNRMQERIEKGENPQPIRNRASFALGQLLHITSAELWTIIHKGEPKTAIFCVDGASAANIAMELKALLDIREQQKIVALVVNSHTQSSFSDCPIFAIFNAEKLRTTQKTPAYVKMLTDLFENKVSRAAYKLPWGKQGGSTVYFIEDDNMAESNILQMSLLKEMQSGEGLRQLVAQRGWARTNLLERYQSFYQGVRGVDGRSTSMVQKNIKYLARAKEMLENLELIYGTDKGGEVLNQMLDRVRDVNHAYPLFLNELTSKPHVKSDIIQKQIKTLEENIEILQLYREARKTMHELYLIDEIQQNNELTDFDQNDYLLLQKLTAMSAHELQLEDDFLSSKASGIKKQLTEAIEKYKKPDGFLQMCEAREMTPETESQKLGSIYAAYPDL